MRLQDIRRALISLFWVGVSYTVYAYTIAPFLQPARINEHRLHEEEGGTVSSAERYLRELSPLFPAGSWELQNPKVLRSPQATIVLQEYEVLEDGSLQIEPCTIIFYGDDRDTPASSRGPIILQAPEGAVLAFERPLDPTRPEIGKPVAGRLLGSIRIFSAGRPGESEDLEIFTSNVQVTDQRIWTPDEVRFRIGESHGSGRDMMFSRLETDDQSKSSFGGIDVIELQQLDRLQLHLDGNDLFESFGSTGKSGERHPPIPASSTLPTHGIPVAKPSPPSIVELHCAGPIRFDTRQLIATVENDVLITRQQPGGVIDTIQAETVALHMAKVVDRPAIDSTKTDAPKVVDRPAIDSTKTDASKVVDRPAIDSPPPSSVGPNPEGSPERSRLTVTRVVAIGSPVVVDAPSEGAHVESNRLEYDFMTGRVLLKGSNPFATRLPQKQAQILFRNQQHHVTAASLDFLGGKDRIAWRMVAEGPGNYSGHPTGDPRSNVEAKWSRQLSLQPEEQQQVLRVEGDAGIRGNEFGTIEGETIEFWLRYPIVAGKLAEQPVPSQFVAIPKPREQVRLNTPRLVGDLDLLRLILLDPPEGGTLPQPEAFSPSSLRDGGPQESVGRGGHLSGGPTGDSDRKGRAKPPESRYEIRGGELTAWVVRPPMKGGGSDDPRDALKRIVIQGESQISEVTTDLARNPLRISGHTIDLSLDGQQRPMGFLQGNPARFGAGGVEVAGANVKIEGNRNRIWIPGQGSLRMPWSRLAATQPHRAEARSPGTIRSNWTPVDNRQGPHVADDSMVEWTWSHSLEFDGQEILLQGNVVAQGTQVDFRASQASAVLQEKINFGDIGRSNGRAAGPRSNSPVPKLGTVTAQGGVEFSYRQLDDWGAIESVQHVITNDFRWDARTGDAIAQGPGWLAITMPASAIAASPMPAPRATESTGGRDASENRATDTDGAGEEGATSLSHVSIAFGREIVGNTVRREAHLYDQIQAWYGPVSSWSERIDPLSDRPLTKQDIRMRSDEMFVLETPSATEGESNFRRPIEIQARGHTYIEGLDFAAQGHQLKYSEEKELITLEGDEPREGNSLQPAELWRRDPQTGRRVHTGRFQRIQYHPRTQRTKAEGGSGIELNAGRESSPRSPSPF